MIGVLAILVVIAAVVLVALARDSVNDAFEGVSVQSGGEESDDEVAGAGDEVDDVAPCIFVDAETITLDVTNNSSKQSTYVIDVNFRDTAGERLADEPFFINDLRPGERTVEDAFVFDGDGAASCEIAEVERFASESPDDVSEVTCEVTGLDFADDIAASLVATNGSSGLSDYAIDFSIVRDGLRVGTGFAFIENVKAGESAPGDGFTTVDGPAEGARCEVVNVQRTES